MNSFSLPPDAQRYLLTPQGTGAERAVCRFHRWMKAKQVIPTGLSLEDVESFFLKPLQRTVSPRTSRDFKRALIRYLNWLDDEGQLGFDPKQLSVRRTRPLPELATQFVKSLEPTLKRSTRNRYQSSLSRFHECLHDNHISLKRLNRAHAEQWLLALSDEGLAPATRVQLLVITRVYLHWLFERNELRADPDDLIRSSGPLAGLRGS